MRTRFILVLVLSAALVVPSAALAETPGDDTYSDVLTRQVASDPGTSASQGSVPFTGLEVGLIVLVATALLGAGFAIRYASRPRAEDS
jgi:hypothetical protein